MCKPRHRQCVAASYVNLPRCAPPGLHLYLPIPFSSSLRPVPYFPLLLRMLRHEFLRIHFEELRRMLRGLARDIDKRSRGDVVRLTLADQGVVLKQVLFLGGVGLGLMVQDSLGFGSLKIVNVGSWGSKLGPELTRRWLQIASRRREPYWRLWRVRRRW